MVDQQIFLASDLGRGDARSLLQRIKDGETVSADERLTAIRTFMATSPRDWAVPEDLWTLYQMVFYNTKDFVESERG